MEPQATSTTRSIFRHFHCTRHGNRKRIVTAAQPLSKRNRFVHFHPVNELHTDSPRAFLSLSEVATSDACREAMIHCNHHWRQLGNMARAKLRTASINSARFFQDMEARARRARPGPLPISCRKDSNRSTSDLEMSDWLSEQSPGCSSLGLHAWDPSYYNNYCNEYLPMLVEPHLTCRS